MSDSIITVDGCSYDTEKFTAEGKALVRALLEADLKLQEASMTVSLMQAATLTLVNDLKTHLTEEAKVVRNATEHEE
jgi:alpha-N-acetylglucosamine transferase|tara:strand:+ start:1019 stop:1249 length:231 start_codon:yes stop_codon:yes gene_type:complete